MDLYEKLQRKGKLSELEERILFNLPLSENITVAALSWKLYGRNNEIIKALEELNCLNLVDRIESKENSWWKINDNGRAIRHIKEENNKKLVEIDKKEISQKVL